jgi:hypothetical protein
VAAKGRYLRGLSGHKTRNFRRDRLHVEVERNADSSRL